MRDGVCCRPESPGTRYARPLARFVRELRLGARLIGCPETAAHRAATPQNRPLSRAERNSFPAVGETSDQAMPLEVEPFFVHREKVEKTVAQRVEAGFVTDVIVIFRPSYRKTDRRILATREPEARWEKIQVLKSAAMKSLDVVAGALLRRNARMSIPGWPVALDGSESRSEQDPGAGSGLLVSSWLANSVSFLASPDWIKKLASHRLVARILTNKDEQLPEPYHTAVRRPAAPKAEAAWGLEHLGIPKLWRQGLSGKGMLIGHLDTGVDPGHPDLENRIAAWEAFDQFGQRLTGTPRYDSGFHGTHTAGTIAGGASRGVAIGAAPGATLASALVLPQGSGTTKQIVTGVEWCVQQGVKILNLSLGGSGYNQAYDPAVFNLGLLGIFPSFSVGNSGLGVTGSPANHSAACAVGAVNAQNEVADFSGGGAFVWSEQDVYVKPDICAPGVSIRSAIPTAYVQQTGAEPFDELDGTSMAAPHVSGTVALLWEAFPDASVEQVKEALYSTALPLGADFHNMHSGRGLIQPLAALEKLDRITKVSSMKRAKLKSTIPMNRVETISLPKQKPGRIVEQ